MRFGKVLRTSPHEPQQFKAPRRRLLTGRHLAAAATAAIVAMLAIMLYDTPVALAACGSPTAVGNTTELNAAITEFNGQAAACAYEIELTSNINLTASITTIDNSVPGVTLSIDGAGFTVSGVDTYETFIGGFDTLISMKDIVVTHSSVHGIRNNSEMTLTNVSALENVGFGIYSKESNTVIEGGSFSNNGDAGIANIITATMEISGALVAGNGTGGISNNQGSLTVRAGSVISGNQGPGIDSVGVVQVDGGTIAHNTGFAGISSEGVLTVTASTISDNGSIGIFHNNGKVTLINSTLSGNAGFAYWANFGEATILNSTIAGNGEAIVANLSPLTITVTNSILSGSTDSQVDCQANNPTAKIVVNFSLVESSSPTCPVGGSGNITGASPLLGPLQDNGGPTLTRAMGSGSVALNAGDDASATNAGLATDQRGAGFPRILGSAVDMGAFEALQYTLAAAKNGNGAGTITSTPAGIDCGTECDAPFISGDVVTLTAVANAGSGFGGWDGSSCSGTGTCVVTMDAAKSVTATFSLLNFTLTVTRTGSGAGVVTSVPAGIDCGNDCAESLTAGTVITLTASADALSTFAGWDGAGCSGTGTCVVTMDAAKSVTATFSLLNFTLTVTRTGSGAGLVTSVPAGIDCGNDCAESLTAGTVITLTASADALSTFAGWDGAGCSGTGTCVVTMDTARNVTAEFVTYKVHLPLVRRTDSQ